MPLQQPLNRGDWVVATSGNGSQIRGQADHDMRTIGSATLNIVVSGDGGMKHLVSINVNFWHVEVERKNLLTEGPF